MVQVAQYVVIRTPEDALRARGILDQVVEFDGSRKGQGDVRNVESEEVTGEALRGWGRFQFLEHRVS